MYKPSKAPDAAAAVQAGHGTVRSAEESPAIGALHAAGGEAGHGRGPESVAGGRVMAFPEECADAETLVASKASPALQGSAERVDLKCDVAPDASVACPVERRPAENTGRRACDRAGWARWRRVIDATQPITPAMPLWPDDPSMVAETVATFSTEGYRLRAFRMGEHSGTHVNAPSSFLPDGVSLEDAASWPLVAPLVIIDLRKRAGLDSGCTCGMDDLEAWENRFGRIPRGAFVACNTGWHRHWDDPRAYFGRTGDSDAIRFPSFAPGAVQWLCAERHVGGIGIDTHGVDAPDDASFSCNRTALSRGCAVVECLGSLDAAPLSGALIIVAPLPLVGGTGAPATVTVLVP